jgi:threonine/homoserine/homoserine lactone efflux protein
VDLLAYLVFSSTLFVLMASPGPGTFAVMARGLGSGFTHAFSMGMGMVLGDLIYVLIAIFGLSTIASMMGDVFVVIKYIGGGYLIYLGVKIFTSKPSNQAIKSSISKSYFKDFISGFLICISNPKVILFYLGFLPTFVDLNTLSLKDIVVISLIVVVLLTIVMTGYSYFSAKAKEAMKKPKAQTIMNRFAGSIMVGVGSVLILK